MALTATVSRDCKYISIEVGYSDAASYPFTGQIQFTDINGAYLMSNTNITIAAQYDTASIVIPVDSLSTTTGLVNIEFLDTYSVVIYTYPVLIHCDIDCCLSKLTNELIDCACDCAKCSSVLAKAQKIFLLIKSAEYALSQTYLNGGSAKTGSKTLG